MENDNKVNSRNTGKRNALFGILIIFLIFSISCLCVVGCLTLTIASLEGTNFNIAEETITQGSQDKIVVVEIYGVISASSSSDFLSNTEQQDMATSIINKLERAKNDPNVKAVILDINSPGGEVYASELIYNKIMEVKSSNKVIVALFRDTAASGAYYISTAADYIIASDTTITGSIGVKLETQDLSGLYEKLGIETIEIINSNGNYKVLSNDIKDENSEAYKIYQSILDDVYDQFVDVIVEGRGLSKAEVIKLADGRVYSGKAASENGLIDGIGYFEDAYAKATELADLDNPSVIRYNNNSSYFGELGIKVKSKIDQILNLAPSDSYKIQTLYIL